MEREQSKRENNGGSSWDIETMCVNTITKLKLFAYEATTISPQKID